MLELILLSIITLCDFVSVLFMYKMLQERQKTKIRRIVSKALSQLGVK